MLTLLIIITLTYFKIISGVEDDNKFINSLPEKQKKEFIRTVEKRIQNEVPEVKSPEGNDTNVDLYEKRLEDQGKSIQNIMRSEIDQLKSQQLRSANDIPRQSAHIDLTLRTQPEGHTNKSILFEQIPVAVQYDSENVGNEKSSPNIKNESKSDPKTVGINNTSAERKRSGRRSNDFEFDNVTLANPDINTNTDAVGDTTTVKTITQVQDVEITKDAVDFPVTRTPTTQEVIFETTRQEVSTQADAEKSRMAQGKIITTTDALDSTKLDYFSSTQNITVVRSTRDDSTFNVSGLTLKGIRANSDDLISYTPPYHESLQTGDEFSNVTQYYVNPQSHSVDITAALYNLYNSTVASVLTTTHAVDRNKTAIDTNITVGNVDSSTIFNNLYNSTVASVLTTTHAVDRNKTAIDTNITVGKVDSSTIFNNVTTTTYNVQPKSNDSIKTDFFNKTKDNSTDITNIHSDSVVLDNNTKLNELNITHNLPGSKEPGAINKVKHKDHNQDTQRNVNDVSNNQSGITNLSYQPHVNSLNNDVVTNILRSTSKFTDGKQKQNITLKYNDDTTRLGVLNNKHHIIISGNKNLADVDPESRIRNDSITLAINTKHRQKDSNNTGNITTNNTTILFWYGNGNHVDTESLHKTTHNVNGDPPNHKYNNKTTNEFYEKPLSQKTHTENDNKKSRNTNTTFGFKLHVSDPNNTLSDHENQPKYVPVYNYDPENAYFNPNTGRPWNGDFIEKKVGIGDPTLIKKSVTHSESTKLDIYANGNKKSLRIKDIKERIISASNTKIKQNSNLYDIISGDDSAETSNDDVLYEKPLKHTLKKIREKIYKHQINDKSKDIESDNKSRNKGENKYKNEVRKKYNVISEKAEEEDIADVFRNFGALLQNVLDHTDNNKEIPSKTIKNESSEEVRSSDTDIYRNVAHSLESHNRVIKNKGIQKIVEELEKIQNKIHKKSKKKIGKYSYQSRFQVKDRDEQQKHKKDKIYRFVDTPYADELEYEHIKFEKAKVIKDDYLDLHANILKDLIEANDEGLQKYDWLGTTVLIQAGLEKLQDITEKKIHDEELHPLDEELFEFAMNLHKEAVQIVAEQQNERTMPMKRKRLSFRIPKPKKGRNFNALNRMYGEMSKAKAISLIRSGYNVEVFREFLMCMRNCLNDLHTAIRQISFITTYKNQRWFKNLKQLYLNEAGEKEYLELLLHFVSARLIGLVDESVKKATREDSDFIPGDREADRIEVEFVMTIKICNELSRLNG